MPIIHVFVDDQTLALLHQYGSAHRREIEDLAECAIMNAVRGRRPGPHQVHTYPLFGVVPGGRQQEAAKGTKS
jgi:hypothetical protein